MIDIDGRGGFACVRQGAYGKSLYLPLNFTVNLLFTLFKAINLGNKKTQTRMIL